MSRAGTAESVRLDLRSLPVGAEEALAELQSFIDARREPTLDELAAFLRHEDEVVATKFVESSRGLKNFAAWALWDRAITESERVREAWNPLLDCAARAIVQAGLDIPEKSPAGNLVPEARAQALAAWAANASRLELDRAIGAFRSGVAVNAIVIGARDVTKESIDYWTGLRGPYSAMASNPLIAANPELSGPIAKWAYEEIMNQEVDEYEAAYTLSMLLDNGWQMSREMYEGLMDMTGYAGRIDHDEDNDVYSNLCFPAAEVMAHSRVSHVREKWEHLLRHVLLDASDVLAALVMREDAPEDALGTLLERMEGTSGAGTRHVLYPKLADHPALRTDAKLRSRFVHGASHSVRLKLIPILTAEEYWSVFARFDGSPFAERSRVEWLEAATPAHRAGLTSDRLGELLQDDSAKVRLIAQTFVGDMQHGDHRADEVRLSPETNREAVENASSPRRA